jgi:hypothetical protein
VAHHPGAASSPNALPPVNSTAWTRSISVPGGRGRSRAMPGAAPRTATPAVAPSRHSDDRAAGQRLLVGGVPDLDAGTR